MIFESGMVTWAVAAFAVLAAGLAAGFAAAFVAMIRDSSLVEPDAIFHKFQENTKSLLRPNAFFVLQVVVMHRIRHERREKARHHWTYCTCVPTFTERRHSKSALS